MYGEETRDFARRGRTRLHLAMLAILVAKMAGASELPSIAALTGNGPAEPVTFFAVEVGTASWYGGWHHGRKTANGERFDMYAMTAAHKELPLGTRIRVTNLANQRAVVVRVNDRGPYVAGRVLDVSYAAARRLGFVGGGLVPVRIEPAGVIGPLPVPPRRLYTNTLPRPRPAEASAAADPGWQVQIAALASRQGAWAEWRRVTDRHRALLGDRTPRIVRRALAAGRIVYRIRVGSFARRAAARTFCGALKLRGQDCFVVR